jgi:hypothetical protein
VQKHLSSHQQWITDRMARDQQSLLLLQRVRDRPDAFLSFEVQVKEVPDQPLLSLSVHATYGTFGQAIRSAFGTLIASATETGVYTPDHPPLVIIHQYTPQEYQQKGSHCSHSVAIRIRCVCRGLPCVTVCCGMFTR